ncbi:MAG: putative Se/S carrier-like protein [Oscillospiraceae bacterium]
MLIIVLTSITYAMKAQRFLQTQGIKTYLERNIEKYGEFGCGYVLQVPQKQKHKLAVDLLKSRNFKISKLIYN